MASRAVEKRTLAICALVHIVQDGMGAMLYVLAPVLAGAFGLSYAQVGLIKATRSATSSLFELPSGLLAERFGERRLLAFGLASAGLGYLCLAMAERFGPVLVCVAIAGVGGAFQHALSSSVLSRSHADATRLSALGLYNSAGDAGKLLFTALFGVLVGAGIAWNFVVAALAVLAFLLAVVVLFQLRRLGVGEAHRRGEAATGTATDTASTILTAGTMTKTTTTTTAKMKSKGDWGMKDRRGFVAVCSSISLDTCVQSGFLVFLPFLFAEKGVPVEGASFAVVLTLSGGIFGKAGCGYLAQEFGFRLSLTLIQCATALGIAFLLFAPAGPSFFALPILGLFLQGSTSITYGAVSELFRSDRQSRGFGLIYSVSSIAGVLAPVVFGLVGDHQGLRASAAMMVLLSLLAIPPVYFFRSGRVETTGVSA